MNEVMKEPAIGLTIKNVSERTAVPVQTLRAWERRYGVPQPRRAPGNRYRVYSETDIADVLWMKRHIDAGLAPGQASLLLRQQRRPEPGRLEGAGSTVANLRTGLEAALQEADTIAARQLLDEAFGMLTPEQVGLQVVQPAMIQVGERWLRSQMTVWQEHVASNLVRQKLLAVLQSQPPPALSAPHLIAACAPAEEHELGLLLVTLFASRQGWRTTFLGPQTPLQDLVSLASTRPPTAIFVSVTTVVGLTSLIPLLPEENRPPAPLVFGGRLSNLLPSLRDHLPGAFLGEDAATAIRSLGITTPSPGSWSPSKRAWNAVTALRAQRLKIAGAIVAELLPPHAPSARLGAVAERLNFGTLYLLDTLACALAFDVPELMELHKEWLQDAMPTLGIAPEAVKAQRKAAARVLTRALGEESQPFNPLLSRLDEDG